MQGNTGKVIDVKSYRTLRQSRLSPGRLVSRVHRGKRSGSQAFLGNGSLRSESSLT